MSDLLNRFSFSTAKWDSQILLALAVLWIGILACAISSICSQNLTPGMRRFWIAVVILLPVFGLLAYLPFSFGHDDPPVQLKLRSKDPNLQSNSAPQ